MTRQKNIWKIIWIFMGFCFFLPETAFLNAAHADVVMICHPAVSTDTLSRTDVKKIFLGKKLLWDDDREIRFVVMKKSPVHKEFVKTYTQKSASQFRRYWKKLIFTGKGSAPTAFDTEAEVIAYVSETEGAIGYVSSEIRPENVKILRISDK